MYVSAKPGSETDCEYPLGSEHFGLSGIQENMDYGLKGHNTITLLHPATRTTQSSPDHPLQTVPRCRPAIR